VIRLVVGRLVQAVPVLLGVTVITFLLMRLSGDPTQLMIPVEATAEQRQAFREAYGLDDPLPIQYFNFLAHAVQGDFGESLRYSGQPALDVVLQHLPATLELALLATVLGLAIAIPAGVLAAVKRDSLAEKLVMGISVLGQSIPTHWLGMMLILLFSVQLGWLPVSGRGSVEQMVLPVLSLLPWTVALIARLTRSEMLEVLGNEYVRTARAKGLPELQVLVTHALRNALIPLIAVIVIQCGGLIGGAIMTEIVYDYPGLGVLVKESVLRRDYPVVMAALTVVATGLVALNLLADICYSYIDPRVRR
jgi:ABC-type dipeptide/oligopeptide/nickel transport system permease component